MTPELQAVDPLTATCSWCCMKPGERCMMPSGPARTSHAVRRKLALALARADGTRVVRP